MGSKSTNASFNGQIGISPEPVDQLVFSGGHLLHKGQQARKAKKVWIDTGLDRLMTFIEFRQQGTRNKRLKEYGREPIILPWEGKPKAKRRRG